MGEKDLKKILAGLGIATLVSAAGVTLPPHVHAGSGWGAKDNSTVSADKVKTPAGSGWGGTKGAVSTDEEKKPAGSGWGGTKGAVSTDKEKKPAGSGWGGSN